MSDQTMIELARRTFATDGFHWLCGMPATAKFKDGSDIALICLGSEAPYYTADFYCFDYMEQWEDIHIDDQIEMELLPDLNGGAALGCLLALVREVTGLFVWVEGYERGFRLASPGIPAMQRLTRLYPTELHALVAALEAGSR